MVKNGAFCHGVIAHCSVVYSLFAAAPLTESTDRCHRPHVAHPALAMAGVPAHPAAQGWCPEDSLAWVSLLSFLLGT